SYELGKVNIPIPLLKKLALFFNTSIDYLLDMTNEKKPYPRKKD
ncbi:MAG TPA: helix-turn-helix transcriptional regulator, partial [Candidatus Pelethomonas intestinigallinarum]|nr:helix-turn-helix transcriptional regulator [Candidatus Pelethomonas intestinigallinarum]